jgi:tungstate transport system substrate-binding protein
MIITVAGCWQKEMGMHQFLLFLALVGLLAGCGAPSSTPGSAGGTAAARAAPATLAARPAVSSILRLATTTSTQDSGLLDAILPEFERQYQADVQVVAVGTGQALKLGENGDADVVLVHARQQEDAFVAAGFGINRHDVMYNDFVIVGPADDPAGIRGKAKAVDAFKVIADKRGTFAARGDNSGTSTKELSIWASAAISPTEQTDWYKSLGQGMGETLITANEQRAYALADRGTYLAMRDRLPNLAILVGGASIADNTDKVLLNPYGVIPVNPQRHSGVNAALAEQFAVWLTSAETQARIAAYGKDRYGQPLFFVGPLPA